VTVATEQREQTAGGVLGPPDPESQTRRHFRRNVALTVGEAVCFSLGMAFFDSSTVIPGFITALTGSAILLGLAPTVMQLGTGLPQLAAASFLAHRPRKMPFLVGASIVRNIPFFALAALAWARPEPTTLLVAFFAGYLLFALGMGLESIAWMDIFAKVYPPRQRGRIVAVGRTAANVLSIGAGFLISRILAGGHFPRDYALLFLIAGVLMTGAFLSFAGIHEPAETPAPDDEPPGERAVLTQGRRVLRDDPTFRRYLAARCVYTAYYVALPFYFRYAHDVVGIGDVAIGRFVSASMGGQIVANLVWGYIGDRFGSKRVVQGILVIGLLLPCYVLATPRLPHDAFLLVYVATGAILAGDMIGWMNLLLALAPAGRRPLYVSLQGTLLLPANLLPLLGGVALNVVPYPAFFAAVAAAFAASFWLVSRVDEAVGQSGGAR
jgi:MFS family permease